MFFRNRDPNPPALKPASVLVLDTGKQSSDWKSIFQGARLSDGREIQVCQVGWDEFMVSAEPQSSLPLLVHVHRRRPALHPDEPKSLTLQPDFVLIRNEVWGGNFTKHDHRTKLHGLMWGNIPSVNSLESIYMMQEKAVVQSKLYKLNRDLGDAFPVIPAQYFAGHEEMMYSQSFPAVVKVGSAHAGQGKMVVQDHHQMEDFRTVLAMTEGKSLVAEPFIEGAFDLRIQKVGRHVRAFKRTSVSGTWKTNTGSAHIEELEVTDKYRFWVERASELFGGLDICTVDAIHETQTGRELILEVNGTSSGFAPDRYDEDNVHIRELVMEKLEAWFHEKSTSNRPAIPPTPLKSDDKEGRGDGTAAAEGSE